jgi:hypothetical protein
MPSSTGSATRSESPSADSSLIAVPNLSSTSNNNKKLFLNSATNNGFLRVLSANSSPTGVAQDSSNTSRKNSSTSEKLVEELEQLLGIGDDGDFSMDPQAQQRKEIRIIENPVLKRNPASSPISVALSDVPSGVTQTAMHTVVRYDPSPAADSGQGRHGCRPRRRKTNSTARTSLERYVIVVAILLLIACLSFLIFSFLFRSECSDGKTQSHSKSINTAILKCSRWTLTLRRFSQKDRIYCDTKFGNRLSLTGIEV